jgi:hypothetical protein
MSTPSPAPNPTKQLLDELDALMQRMLALPVNTLGDEVENLVPQQTTAAATALPPSVVDRPAPDAPKDRETPPRAAPEVIGARHVSHHLAGPALASPQRMDEPAPVEQHAGTVPGAPVFIPAAPPVGYWSPRPLPAPMPVTQTKPKAPAVAPSGRIAVLAPPRLPSWWLRSLLWGNRTFDRWACTLGRPGQWLQGRAGRIVLGWLGIGLIFASVAWAVADWFDWTW